MPNLKKSFLSSELQTKLKLHLLDAKLTLRKFKKNVEDNHVFHNAKKFYLIFLIIACLAPLYALKPYASSEDSRFLRLASQLQVDSQNNSIEYLELSTFTPNLKEVVSKDFQVYTLKSSETKETITARFPNLKKETIEINNQNREWKEGNEIVIPNNNGLLIGFNKESKNEEYAKALSKSVEELNKMKNGSEQGFIFIKSDDPKRSKEDFDQRIREIQTPITQASAAQLNNRSFDVPVYSNRNGDLAPQFSDFVNRTKGRLQHDGNGWYPGQCVSLVKQWQLYLGGRTGVWPGGYPAPAIYSYFSGNTAMAPETPSFRVAVIRNVNALSAGDLIVMTGYPSHTGIATGRVGGGTFDMYDQNSPFGSPPKFSTYGNGSFIGALRYVKK
ncbi:MAG: hypothetical protein ACRCXZ_06795 [Patescibacteria group bacterium]